MNLKKFTKNKKIKTIFIGSTVGILLLIGGITLYKTFALYKEEKTYNVIQGKVPDFVYKENILNGAYPVLKSSTGEKLIPVIIGDDGKVTKADIKDEWYSYEKKKWANAVILVDGVEEPKNDEIIPEENIESYFVWIPKYKYKIFNMGNYETYETIVEDNSQEIEIEFGIYDTVDNTIECTTPPSGENGTCAVDKWMTPSAFTAFGTNGFWVGKFETGYKGADASTFSNSNTEKTNVVDKTKVVIKPNQYSWRWINVKNMFDTSYNYKRDLDSHLMKNTEWGAVAYLQHSKYGSGKSVRINNNSAYVTGYAATEEPTTGLNAYNGYENKQPTQDGTNTVNYTNPDSKVASTTGNYSGVYDMNGGSWEYVMGVMKGLNNIGFTFGQSGFSTATFPFNDVNNSSKYYDVYNYYETNTEHWNRRILGDATGELGPFGQKKFSNQLVNISSWYDDAAYFVYKVSPWFLRSGVYYHGSTSGVFAFTLTTGDAFETVGFRIVLTPTITK